MGLDGPIASILSDLYRTLERLSFSFQSNDAPPLPSLVKAHDSLHTPAPPPVLIPRLNPIPSIPSTSHGSQIFSVRPYYLNPHLKNLHPGLLFSQDDLLLALLKGFLERTLRPVNQSSLKLSELRDLAIKGVRVCYKCGGQGHSTVSCRSALICFSCGKVGHKATSCKPSSPPIPILTQPSSPPAQPDWISFPLPQSDPSTSNSPPKVTMLPPPSPARLREASILPVMWYYATPATTQFRHSLSQGVVFTDSRRMGASCIQVHLSKRFPIPRWTWVVRELSEDQYLVAPPDC